MSDEDEGEEVEGFLEGFVIGAPVDFEAMREQAIMHAQNYRAQLYTALREMPFEHLEAIAAMLGHMSNQSSMETAARLSEWYDGVVNVIWFERKQEKDLDDMKEGGDETGNS